MAVIEKGWRAQNRFKRVGLISMMQPLKAERRLVCMESGVGGA